MTLRLNKQFLYLIMLVLLSSLAFASVEDYVNSLTFDYYSGQINITNFDDLLIDSDSDGVNDTLVINLTTLGDAGVYSFIADLEDSGGIISSVVEKNILFNHRDTEAQRISY